MLKNFEVQLRVCQAAASVPSLFIVQLITFSNLPHQTHFIPALIKTRLAHEASHIFSSPPPHASLSLSPDTAHNPQKMWLLVLVKIVSSSVQLVNSNQFWKDGLFLVRMGAIEDTWVINSGKSGHHRVCCTGWLRSIIAEINLSSSDPRTLFFLNRAATSSAWSSLTFL